MRRSSIALIAVAILMFQFLPAVASAAAKPTVRLLLVNCTKGESIQVAIDSVTNTSGPVVVEFSGVCAERLLITRDELTLRGADSAAVIDGATLPPPAQNGVVVRGASKVSLEQFTVQGALRAISIEAGADANISHVTTRDNSRSGINVIEHSGVYLTDCVSERNGRYGMAAFGASHVYIPSGTFTTRNNGNCGLVLSASALTIESGAAIEVTSNTSGIYLQMGATVEGFGKVTATQNRFAGVGVGYDSTFNGIVDASGNMYGVDVEDSTVWLDQSTISGNLESGIFALNAGAVSLTNSSVDNNAWGGLVLDGSVANIVNLTATGNSASNYPDIEMKFGTHAEFVGTINPAAITVTCDSTVLTRGDVACPPASTLTSGKARVRPSLVDRHPRVPMTLLAP